MRPVRRNSTRRRESVRTKRVLNVRLLLISVGIAVALGVFGHLWYRHEITQEATVFLQRAAQLEKDEQWFDAAGYLRRYVRTNPDDLETRVRLVEVVGHLAGTPAGARSYEALLYETLGLLPDRSDLRIKLAEKLLQTGQFVEAEAEASKVVATGQDADKPAARRVIAVSLRARASSDGLVTWKAAADALRDALADDPGDVTIATLTAELYREHPQESGGTATEADEIVNKMVSANPGNAEASLARYGYRKRLSVAEGGERFGGCPDHQPR